MKTDPTPPPDELGEAPSSATAGRIKARLEGAVAAVAGRNLDANNYHQDDARMARMKSPNDTAQAPDVPQ